MTVSSKELSIPGVEEAYVHHVCIHNETSPSRMLLWMWLLFSKGMYETAEGILNKLLHHKEPILRTVCQQHPVSQ